MRRETRAAAASDHRQKEHGEDTKQETRQAAERSVACGVPGLGPVGDESGIDDLQRRGAARDLRPDLLVARSDLEVDPLGELNVRFQPRDAGFERVELREPGKLGRVETGDVYQLIALLLEAAQVGPAGRNAAVEIVVALIDELVLERKPSNGTPDCRAASRSVYRRRSPRQQSIRLRRPSSASSRASQARSPAILTIRSRRSCRCSSSVSTSRWSRSCCLLS